MECKVALAIQIQKTLLLKNSEFWLVLYNLGFSILVCALQFWSNSPMAMGGAAVIIMLYKAENKVRLG